MNRNAWSRPTVRAAKIPRLTKLGKQAFLKLYINRPREYDHSVAAFILYAHEMTTLDGFSHTKTVIFERAKPALSTRQCHPEVDCTFDAECTWPSSAEVTINLASTGLNERLRYAILHAHPQMLTQAISEDPTNPYLNEYSHELGGSPLWAAYFTWRCEVDRAVSFTEMTEDWLGAETHDEVVAHILNQGDDDELGRKRACMRILQGYRALSSESFENSIVVNLLKVDSSFKLFEHCAELGLVGISRPERSAPGQQPTYPLVTAAMSLNAKACRSILNQSSPELTEAALKSSEFDAWISIVDSTQNLFAEDSSNKSAQHYAETRAVFVELAMRTHIGVAQASSNDCESEAPSARGRRRGSV